MKFLLYSLNYAPELTGIGKYNGELAPKLAQLGVETHVLTAPPYYPEWQMHDGYKNGYSTVKENDVTLYRAPLYVPKQVTTLKRLVHLSSFALTSGLRLFSLWRAKPDVIFVVQPTLFCAPLALLFAKLRGAKTILHIQDFEIDAMFGLGMAGGGKTGKLKKIILAAERFLMRRFDKVSSISYSMLENAQNKGVDKNKLLFFPNWSDTDFVHPDICGASLKQAWGYQATDKIVLYSGNIGKKQGLEIVLDVAEALKSQPDVKFIIIGNGAHSETLQQQAKARALSNIAFKPLQPWEDIPQILAMADVHLVIQKKGAADAVLPSKLTNILSVGGNAVITAEPHTELGKIAQAHEGIYTLVEPENSAALIDSLLALLAADSQTVNQKARQYAEQNLNTKQVIQRFYQDLKELVE